MRLIVGGDSTIGKALSTEWKRRRILFKSSSRRPDLVSNDRPFIDLNLREWNVIKEYEFEIKWGEQTSTDDKEGDIINRSINIPNYKDINSKLKEFTGTILQAPPKASAIKINGVRAYKLLRSNKEFVIKKKSKNAIPYT